MTGSTTDFDREASGRWRGAAGGVAAFALAISTAATAQGSRPTGPLSMDVAGVRLGMSADDAAKALGAAYACRRDRDAQSFSQQVDAEVVRRSGRFAWPDKGAATNELTCKGPNGEDLVVRFAQTPGGSVADTIRFNADGDRIDVGEAVKVLTSKYGTPSRGTVANGAWCGSERCSPLTDMQPGPRYDVSSSTRFLSIVAVRGAVARAADGTALKAAADRAAPPSRKPAL